MTNGARLRLASALAVRHAVGEVARVLAPAGIVPLVLKGALLQSVYGADPAERVASDVDLLVPPERFEEAHACLVAAGFRPEWREPDDRERVLTVPEGRLQVDLHRALFHDGQFALPTASLLARAMRDETSFDAPVLVPHPLDLFAHLVGHGAETYLAQRRIHHPGDIDLVASRAGLDAMTTAGHLVRHGLGSAAGWWLPLVEAVHPSAFVRAVVEALPATFGARLSGAVVHHLAARVGARSVLGLVLHKAMHRTPMAALRSVTGAVWRTTVRRVR
jgi:hypothetical protein